MYQVHKQQGGTTVPITHHTHTRDAGERQLNAYKRAGHFGLKLVRVSGNDLLDYYEADYKRAS